jgi:integrase
MLALFSKAADESQPECPYVFHKNGEPITRSGMYRAWKRAAKSAGLPAITIHDLCRTAMRNMVRSGTHERVAMVVAGRKTRSTFDRYNIVSESDALDAQDRLGEYLSSQPTVPILCPPNSTEGSQTGSDIEEKPSENLTDSDGE